jgi:protocatechuate 3,4-dioxygenase beta subunit
VTSIRHPSTPTSSEPGPYPWKNHINAWRPAHIHFSVFGPGFTQRIITQVYFPGDPLFPLDPIYNTIRSQKDRDRLIAAYDHDLTVPEFSMGYRWDIVVDGPDATWFEPEEGEH